ncbi:MAG: GWxTD domain-containing protein [bacterium]
MRSSHINKMQNVLILPLLLFYGITSLQHPLANNQQSDEINTADQYLTRLNESNNQTFQFEFEEEFLLLLDDEQKETYHRLIELQKRKAFIINYWKLNNPNPLLVQNDRLVDYLRRRAYARKNFPLDVPPYFDDRGKYYIKYGKPLFRYRDYGGQRSMESLVNIPFKYYSVKPNESWSYVNVAPNYVVHFMESDKGYKEIASLKDVILDSQRRSRVVWYWFDLLKRRFWMSSLVTEAVNDIEQLETEVMIVNQGARATIDRVGSPAFRISNQMYTNLQQAEYKLNLARIDVPAVVYDLMKAKNRIPFVNDIAQFRGSNDETKVAVSILSPLRYFINRKNLLKYESVQAEFSSLIRDLELDSLASAQMRKTFPAKLAVDENLSNVVGFMTLQVPPQPVELAFQVKNEKNEKIGFTREDITLRDFSGDEPMISDIQLLMTAQNSNQTRVLPIIENQDLKLAPYPDKKIQKSRPLICYFEVYNLQPEKFGHEYQITYKVYRDKNRESVFKKLTKKLKGTKDESISITNIRELNQHTTNELIELDLSKLQTGPYKLEISLQNTQESAEFVTAQKDLTISE